MQDRHVHCCPGVVEGDAVGTAPDAFGEADAPGWVDGCTAGGFTAAAGCPRACEFGPVTEVGFGVPLACGETDGAGDAEATPPGAADDSGAAIAYADAGFLFARTATDNSIAQAIGNPTGPLFSTTPA